MWTVPFAVNGNKNTIQKVRQPTQDPQDATLDSGFPPITMQRKEVGGLPPKGLDFNGIFYALSENIVHRNSGGRIQFDQSFANDVGGYSIGAIVQSNDTTKEYRSLVDNNTSNPNTLPITGLWEVYSGSGSLPNSSTTQKGIVQLVNDLTTGGADKALTAEQGKVLLAMFSNSLLPSGYQKIPNPLNPNAPLLLQWFTGTIPSGNSSANFNYPIAFTSACFQVVATDAGFGAKTYGAAPLSTSQSTIYTAQSSGGSSFRALAIGY